MKGKGHNSDEPPCKRNRCGVNINTESKQGAGASSPGTQGCRQTREILSLRLRGPLLILKSLMQTDCKEKSKENIDLGDGFLSDYSYW